MGVENPLPGLLGELFVIIQQAPENGQCFRVSIEYPRNLPPYLRFVGDARIIPVQVVHEDRGENRRKRIERLRSIVDGAHREALQLQEFRQQGRVLMPYLIATAENVGQIQPNQRW